MGRYSTMNFYVQLLVVLAVLLTPVVVLAEAIAQKTLQARIDEVMKDKRELEVAMTKGRAAADFCILCHGEDGNSTKPDVPHLAEQNPVYLLDQIERFADGRRTDYIMSPLAKKLTADEIVALVVYYSEQKRVPTGEQGLDPAVLVTGREIFERECIGCHGDDGKGMEGYAYIAGLPLKYLASTLTHFREREKGRTNALMSAVVKQMSNEEIDAIAAYVSSLH